MQPKVHVKDIHVPLVLMVTFIITILGGATSFAVGWYQLTEHVSDTTIHPTKEELVEGGGLAFKSDVVHAETAAREERRAQYKATRKLLINMQIHCTRTRRGGQACTVTLPEE